MVTSHSDRPLDVAVVGAGLSGLTCARVLTDAGHRTTVFEKARGPGGRMSTRRSGRRRFDHGAQYFTVRHERFARAVAAWRELGLVAPWDAQIGVLGAEAKRSNDGATQRFVGVPGMNAVCSNLAAGLEVVFESRVATLERLENRWHPISTSGGDLGAFDAVVISAPAPQAAQLLAPISPSLAASAAGVEMAPCWAVMASFEAVLDVQFDAAFVHGSPLSWVARNGSKPGRPSGESWVLHGSPDWSREHLEVDAERAAESLLDAFRAVIGLSVHDPVHLRAHRWRFSLPVEPLAEACLFDERFRVGACGDWCGGPRVEGAFLSGSAIAEQLMALCSSKLA